MCIIEDVIRFVVSKIEYVSPVWSHSYIRLQLNIEFFVQVFSCKADSIYSNCNSYYHLFLHRIDCVSSCRELETGRFMWKLMSCSANFAFCHVFSLSWNKCLSMVTFANHVKTCNDGLNRKLVWLILFFLVCVHMDELKIYLVTDYTTGR